MEIRDGSSDGAWYNLGVLYDLYMQDIESALQAYRNYQDVLTSAEVPVEADPLVNRWIVDLERRQGQALASANEAE